MYETLKLAIVSFVLPPGGPLVLMLLGLLLLRRRPRAGRLLCITGVAALWLAALPIAAAGLVTALGGARPLDFAATASADAIVILGGGVRPQAAEYDGDTLGRLTLERTRYGAWLARKTALPVLVTGGRLREGTRTEAELMRDVLVAEYQVPVRWLEDQSRNTRENAQRAAQLLLRDGKRRIVLVMHGFDAARVPAQFEAAGLQVIPAPTQVPRWDALEVSDFLPSAAALQTSFYATYEILALCRDALWPD